MYLMWMLLHDLINRKKLFLLKNSDTITTLLRQKKTTSKATTWNPATAQHYVQQWKCLCVSPVECF